MTTPNIRELRRQRARHDERWPWPIRLLLVLAALYLVYALLGFFVAPGIIKKQIETRASEQLKREVRVGEVAFNPLTLSLKIDRLLVAERGKEPVLGWASLFVNFDMWSLVSHEIHFAEINLDAFVSRLVVSKEGVLNIADILEGSGSSKTSSGEPWALRIDKLSVNRAEMDYVDESHPETFHTHVGPTTFVLREFRTSGSAGAPGVFTANTEAGENIAWTGRIALAPLRSNGEVRLTKVALKKYAPFYSSFVNFDILNGTADVQVPYEFYIQANKPQVKVTEAAAKVQGLEIAERGKTEALIALPSIEITPLSADLQARTADIGRIFLNGGRIVAVRTLDGVSLQRLLPTSTAKPANVTASPAANASGADAFRVNLGEFATKDLVVSVDDPTLPKPGSVQLTHVNIAVKRVSTADLSVAAPVSFAAEIAPGGGAVRVEGQVSPAPLKGELTYSVEGLSLNAVSPWAESFIDGTLAGGLLNVRGRAQLGTSARGELSVGATADLDMTLFELKDASGATVATWKNLNVSEVNYTSSPARLTASGVSLADPSVQILRSADGTLNVAKLMRPTAPTAAPQPTVTLGKPAAQPSALFIAIDRVAIANGHVAFVDKSVEPSVQTTLDQISGTITGVTSAAIDRADVHIDARIAGAAPVSVTGTANVLAADRAIDLKIEAHDAELSPLSPYAGKYVGYRLSSGALSVDAKAKVNGKQLDSLANIVVGNLALGEATNSPDAPKVPIHLALALLRDRDGKITLALPVQGSLDDPSFKIGGVISKVIGNLITKAATSPFSLIGAMFGGGKAGEDLSFLDFQAGSSQLDDQDRKKLDILAKALRERPGIHLALVGGYDTNADLNLMRDRELERRIRTVIWEQAKIADPSLASPDQVTVTREGASRVLADMYREIILRPYEHVIGAETHQQAPETAAQSEQAAQKKRFFLFRWFLRDKPAQPQPAKPAPQVAQKPAQKPGQKGGPAASPAAAPEVLPPEGEMRAKLLQALPIAEGELKTLALERAEEVRRYVLAQSQAAADRVEIAQNEVGANGARVSLKLK